MNARDARNKIAEISNQESDNMALSLTPKLRKFAIESGWPEHIVSKLEIRYDASSQMYVYYPEELDNAVNDLEYGTISTPPHSVLRRFSNRMGSFVNDVSDVDLIDNLLAPVFG